MTNANALDQVFRFNLTFGTVVKLTIIGIVLMLVWMASRYGATKVTQYAQAGAKKVQQSAAHASAGTAPSQSKLAQAA